MFSLLFYLPFVSPISTLFAQSYAAFGDGGGGSSEGQIHHAVLRMVIVIIDAEQLLKG